jgi:hypothetical protein
MRWPLFFGHFLMTQEGAIWCVFSLKVLWCALERTR